MSLPDSHLLAVVDGRAYRVKIASNVSPEAALRWLIGDAPRLNSCPDSSLDAEWLPTEEGLYIRKSAVTAFTVGHLDGASAVPDPD